MTCCDEHFASEDKSYRRLERPVVTGEVRDRAVARVLALTAEPAARLVWPLCQVDGNRPEL